MAKPKLTLYIDIVSPFAYLAFHVTKNSPIFKDCDVKYVPILLGGVMKATGNTPPIRIKNKDKWIETERLRWAKYCNIPVAQTAPEGFPPNTITAQRALCAIELSKPDKLPSAIAELYQALWVDRDPIQNADVLGSALAKALGESEAKEMVEKASSPEAKARLSKNTEKAMEDGAFGLPWFVATNAQGQTEGFWGFDHLGQVIDHLGLDRGKSLRAML